MLGAPGMRVLGGGARDDRNRRSGAPTLPSPIRARAAEPAPELDPRTRGYLLALAELRKRRLTPTKRPWKARLGVPDFPPSLSPLETRDIGSPGSAPGSAIGAGPTAPFVGEPRIANALWTTLAKLDGIDIGVGDKTGWVAQNNGMLQSFRLQNGAPSKTPLSVPGGAKRVSVSAPSDSDGAEIPWVVSASDQQVRYWRHLVWSTLEGSQVASVLDVAAGRVDDSALGPSGGVLPVFRATVEGRLEVLGLLGAAGQLWFPINLVQYGLGPQNPATVAVERVDPQFDGAVWYQRATDDQVSTLKGPGDSYGTIPGGAWDLGAGGGEVYVVGNTESADKGAKGNSLWHLDQDTKKWELISPGWAMALDVDERGHPWVLDSEGRVHVRGARMPGVAAGVRGAPKDATDEMAWLEYLNAYGDTYASFLGLQANGPGLQPETNLQARLLGAGGSILLLPWDELDFPAAGAKQFDLGKLKAKQRIKKALAKDPGIEALFCLAPIMTTLPRVPADVLTESGAFNGTYVDFANVKVIDAYLAAVSELAAIPGFMERVRYFSVGNEVDVHLGGFLGQADPWNSFTAFCKAVVPEVKKLLPRASIGVTWTFQGIRKYPALWRPMNELCDSLFVNYYAVDSENLDDALVYRVLDEPTYTSDLGEILDLPAKYQLDKPIVLQEVGMPTDPELGGSPSFQKTFVDRVFEHWDAAGLRIPFLSWFQLYDYLYDENLTVTISNGAIVVAQNTSPWPTTFTYYGQNLGPFWGIGNNFAYVFRPFNPASPVPPLEVRRDLINASTSGGRWERLCRFLSRCGLLDQTGEPKLAWDAYRFALTERRRQT